MTDRPASWRMPTPKQMEKMAIEAGRQPALPAEGPEEPLPAEYWQSVDDFRVTTEQQPFHLDHRLLGIPPWTVRVLL
jgi:hypothetical protein